MSTRKIKDAKDLESNELIYFKGHAKATYMSNGQTVEDAINNIQDSGEGIAPETDPIFSASPAAKITDVNITSWNNKVDKIDGKQLSTEDFTTILKQKLDGLSNYNDMEIQEAISKLRTDLDTLVSGDTTTAIKTFNEVIAFLDGLKDTEDLASIIASIEQQIAAKGTYSKPSTGIPESDLDDETQNALSLAKTALQSIPTSYVTESELSQKDYATTSYVNTSLNTFNANLNKKQDTLVNGTNIKTINNTSILGSGNIVIEADLSDCLKVTDQILTEAQRSLVMLNLRLEVPTESVISGWGFTKNTGTYSKPSTGIPKSDLSSEVQTSLNKASTALQEIPSSCVTLNLLNSRNYVNASYVDSQINSLRASINVKQDTLVSGTNIKTINGLSILGSGNIAISGDSSGGGSGTYAEVNHGTDDTTFALTPNTFHVWDEVTSLDLSFADEQAGVANEYLFQFTSGATATTLTLPDVRWANDNAPTIAENMIYQVSVLKGLASVLEFNNVKIITFTFNNMTYQAEEGWLWMDYVNSKYNDGTFYISGFQIYTNYGPLYINGGIVGNTSVIQANGYYYAQQGSGGS